MPDQPTHKVLREIQDLDREALNFRQQLDKKLRAQEYDECVEGLTETDVRWFVEYLDGVCAVSSIPTLS